jgi:hypothetical protein
MEQLLLLAQTPAWFGVFLVGVAATLFVTTLTMLS